MRATLVACEQKDDDTDRPSSQTTLGFLSKSSGRAVKPSHEVFEGPRFTGRVTGLVSYAAPHS